MREKSIEQKLKTAVVGMGGIAPKFVSPGFDEEIAGWCVQNKIPVIPGCVTPTEIMRAMRLGLSVLKFFPATVYGGLSAMKSLAGPFPDIRFLPTGGVVVGLREPEGDGIRVDSGLAVGTEVSSNYDPMLSKVIAHGATREQARVRLSAMLEDTAVWPVRFCHRAMATST